MRKVVLTKNEQFKYTIIKNLITNNSSKYNAALKPGYTIKTINQLIKKYKLDGKPAFSHGNKSIPPVSTIDSQIKETK